MKRIAKMTMLPALFCAAAVQAEEDAVARMSHVEGVVVVNHGEQFLQARRGTVLRSGDRVFVMEGARAELAYQGNCRLRLASNSFLIVGQADECATGHVQVRSFGPHYAAAIGLDAPTVSDVEEGAAEASATEGAVEAAGGAGGAAATATAAGTTAWAVPATLSGVVLYALIAAGGGEKGTPQTNPISAQ